MRFVSSHFNCIVLKKDHIVNDIVTKNMVL